MGRVRKQSQSKVLRADNGGSPGVAQGNRALRALRASGVRCAGDRMKRIRRLLKLAPRTRADARAELADEFDHHLALREAELVKAGLSPEAAHAEAQRAFGDVDAALNRCLREDLEKMESTRRAATLDELRQDLRFAFRQLLRDPAFALLA